MEAHIFLKGEKDGDEKLLAKVKNLEVVPRGIYVIDDEPYQYTGQPTFIIEKYKESPGVRNVGGTDFHVLKRVEIMVEKTKL